MPRPKILVVSLGGTITMTKSEAGGVVPTLTADDLVAAVPGLRDVADLEILSPSRIPGASLSLSSLVEIAHLVSGRLKSGTDGAVVVQGTDTIEETAFLLDLLNTSDRPIVVTGAMRPPEALGADGPANLLGAVTVAAADDAVGLGAVVVLNGEIHAARFVQKSHTERPSAFHSPSLGPIGAVSEGRCRILARPPVGHRIALPVDVSPTRVALVAVALGDDGALLEAAARMDYEGIVLQATGAGHISDRAAEAVARVSPVKPLVLSTRVAAGRVFHQTYGFPGSERDLIEKGVLPSGYLGAPKARILTSLALAAAYDREHLKDALLAYD